MFVRGDVGVHNCWDGFSPYNTHLLYDQLYRLSAIDSKWLRCRSGFECAISSQWENPFIVTISSEHVFVWDRILIRLWNIYRNIFRFIVLGTHARIWGFDPDTTKDICKYLFIWLAYVDRFFVPQISRTTWTYETFNSSDVEARLCLLKSLPRQIVLNTRPAVVNAALVDF